ncbi:MAG: leucyl/phenylalanyl-tRNA--protein transferase [Schleiferiaceae bacterium]|nr:leucyl/phenylalanyl-tRNA--protein transferase [Schleiferiaceae bacterium]
MYWLPPHKLWFPQGKDLPGAQDIVAVGGDLSPERLLYNYRRGGFPWFNPGEPLLWWHPQRRMVLRPEEVHVGKTSRNLLNRGHLTFTVNQAFEEVIRQCQQVPRPGQEGTWLSDELRSSFVELHRRGHALSVECWQEGELAGGLYGMDLGRLFCGESMFSRVSNASKLSFIHLCRQLAREGYPLIDCQVYNPYLAQLGAYEIDRAAFIQYLPVTGEAPSR